MSKRKLKATATIMWPGNQADPPGTTYMVPGDMSASAAERLVNRGSAKWVVDEAALKEAEAMAEEAGREKMRAELEAELRPKIKAELEAELRPKLEKEIRAALEAEAKTTTDKKTDKSAKTAGPDKAGGFAFEGEGAEAEKTDAGKGTKGSAKK